MPVLDDRQPRSNFDNPFPNDRKDTKDRSGPIRVRPDHYQKHGKKHYEKNKKYYVEKAAERRKRYKEEWAAFKNTLSCQHCGETHPATFDFHHVKRGPNNVKIFQLIKNGAYKKIYEELKKCIVLCANCHRKLHYKENKKGAEAPLD